jgi:hypothetical protein
MSSWGAVAPAEEKPVRRVREDFRDGAAVIIVSALMSTGLAVAVTVITWLAG